MYLSSYRGALFEGLIISELYKYQFNHNAMSEFYFWRDKTGNEIDCLITHGSTITPVEIKASRTFQPGFFDLLNYWQQLNARETTAPEVEKNGYIVMASNAQQPLPTSRTLSW